MRASAAIPALFPAVRVEHADRPRGWYFDGGTRLNTPIKPALALGAERVIVDRAQLDRARARPDAGRERAGPLRRAPRSCIQALLADPLVEDIQTLTTINELVGDAPATGRERRGPLHLRRAARARRDRPDRPRRLPPRTTAACCDAAALAARSRCSAALIDAGRDPLHGELLSYLFFAPEFAAELLELGRARRRALARPSHDDGPWRIGSLPPAV